MAQLAAGMNFYEFWKNEINVDWMDIQKQIVKGLAGKNVHGVLFLTNLKNTKIIAKTSFKKLSKSLTSVLNLKKYFLWIFCNDGWAQVLPLVTFL